MHMDMPEKLNPVDISESHIVVGADPNVGSLSSEQIDEPLSIDLTLLTTTAQMFQVKTVSKARHESS